ncbi:MAG TPA: hypothetical protein VHJ34_07050 [Actinomycetota bacterium]|nr:hypothetical protein [Actinomycetota bacterium]
MTRNEMYRLLKVAAVTVGVIVAIPFAALVVFFVSLSMGTMG